LSINEELEKKFSERGINTSAEIIRFIRGLLNDVLEGKIDLSKLKEGVSADDVGFALIYKGKVYYKSFKNYPKLLEALKEDGPESVLNEVGFYWKHCDEFVIPEKL